MVNSPLIRPAISWGVNVALGGGTLDPHDLRCSNDGDLNPAFLVMFLMGT